MVSLNNRQIFKSITHLACCHMSRHMLSATKILQLVHNLEIFPWNFIFKFWQSTKFYVVKNNLPYSISNRLYFQPLISHRYRWWSECHPFIPYWSEEQAGLFRPMSSQWFSHCDFQHLVLHTLTSVPLDFHHRQSLHSNNCSRLPARAWTPSQHEACQVDQHDHRASTISQVVSLIQSFPSLLIITPYWPNLQ